jgi:hypothetical protein
MPAQSEAQQRLMGMALAAKRGKGHYSGKVKEIANNMTLKQLHDFAATKHEGLPEKKAFIEGFVKRAKEHGVEKEEALEMLHKSEKHEKPKSFIEKMQEKNKGGGMKLMRLGMMRNLLHHKKGELDKQAFLGEPAYRDVPDLSEEELKALSYADLKKRLEPQKGEGALAHIKRHLGSYALGGAGAMAGLAGGSVVDHLTDGNGGGAALAALLGGAAGGALGAAPDALINAARKHVISAKALKELNRLSRHTHARNSLNSPSQTNYNKHSL